MATYYCPSSNNPRDAAAPGPMQHYLREPLPTSYSEVATALPTPTNMMMYMSYSSSSSGSYSDALAGNGNAQQHGIEILSVAVSDSSTPPHHQEIFSNVTGCGSHVRVVEHDFRAWRDGGGNEMMLVTNTLGGPASLLHAGAGQNLQGHQGLSLSLGTQIHSGIQIPSSIQYQNPNQGYRSFLGPPNSSMSGDGGNSSSRNNGNGSSRDENSRKAEFCSLGSVLGANQDLIIKVDPSSSSYGMSSSIARTIPHSKYLKAAQQLLVEVVNVRKALKQPDSEKKQYMHELLKGSEETDDGGSKNGTAVLPPAASNPQDLLSNSSSELSHAERQDLQNKMTKLLAMLDEVDRKYKQYYHQMQIVVSSFDAIGGSGAAKPYTALALQTISHHFRCLRDAITGQIRSTRRSLGEQDTSGNSVQVGISRLRYVDQQLRQQRALQQLGMLQQHAWRPQRGLPESSVSILRAWLFEHFLHPYPKDSDKIMLARQTGLTRSQVSNWFINARVRLWKPMVEEMYKEEIGDADIDSNSSSENATKVVTKGGDVRASEERGDDFQQSITSTGRFLDSEMGVGPTTTGAAFRNGGAHGETQTEYGIVKLTTGEQRPTPTPTLEECSSSSSLFAPDGGSDGFMAAAYHHMSELGRFGSGTGGVSLTLGLQHCAGGGGGGGHHSFVGMNTRGAADDMYNSAASSVGMQTTADFDYGSWEPAVPIQLLPSSMT